MKSLNLFLIVFVVYFLAGCATTQTEDDANADPIERVASQYRVGGRNPAMSPEEAAAQQEEQAMQVNQAVRSGDLVTGMKMSDVIAAWGEPVNVETAGDPSLGNQRWTYTVGLTNPAWTLHAPQRIVYFEAGQVAGWDSR